MYIFETMKRKKTFLAFVLAMLLLLSNVVATPASADNDEAPLASSEIREQLDQMEAKKQENEEEIAQLQSQLQDNLTNMEDIVVQKSLIDREIFLLRKQVDQINEMISAYNVLIADKQDELNQAQERLDILNEQNKARIRAMEEDGAISYWSVLFKANSFSDLLDRVNMIKEIAEADQRRLAEMKAAAEKVAQVQAELALEKANLEDKKTELGETEADLQVKRTEADKLLADLIATGEEYERWLEESEVRQEQLLEQINQGYVELENALASESYSRWLEESYSIYIEESIAESIWIEESIAESIWIEESIAASIAAEATRPTYNKPEDTPPIYGGGWRSPLNESSYVTSPYGWRLHPIYGDWRFHHGVDLDSWQGQTIVATRSGVVAEAGWDPWGGGNYVRIDHGDGYASAYLHMEYYVVDVGDVIYAGETVGYVGSTGGSTGPHLHFSVYYNGSSVNPCDYVSFY